MTAINLVADIGGTNVRVAISQPDGQFNDIGVFKTKDHPSLSAVLQTYIDEKGLAGNVINACLAIACPVEDDLISMTNLPWSFSQKALKAELSLNKLLLINDYTAIAYSIPLLKAEQRVQIGEGQQADLTKPISICGPGTGFGVANLIPVKQGWMSLGAEGGHADFAPVNQDEIDILTELLTTYEHVSYEQLLSGKGIEQIYAALAKKTNAATPTLTAQVISANAVDNSCSLCVQTLQQFCQTLGSYAGNLALTLGSFGGVYIAGGIAPRFIDFIQASEFRSRFESKGRLTGFNKKIPTYVITESQPGLLGASAYIQQSNKEDL